MEFRVFPLAEGSCWPNDRVTVVSNGQIGWRIVDLAKIRVKFQWIWDAIEAITSFSTNTFPISRERSSVEWFFSRKFQSDRKLCRIQLAEVSSVGIAFREIEWIRILAYIMFESIKTMATGRAKIRRPSPRPPHSLLPQSLSFLFFETTQSVCHNNQIEPPRLSNRPNTRKFNA